MGIFDPPEYRPMESTTGTWKWYEPAGWQKCPICSGSGTIKDSEYTGDTECPTCEGKRIICKLTGKPPQTED